MEKAKIGKVTNGGHVRYLVMTRRQLKRQGIVPWSVASSALFNSLHSTNLVEGGTVFDVSDVKEIIAIQDEGL